MLTQVQVHASSVAGGGRPKEKILTLNHTHTHTHTHHPNNWKLEPIPGTGALPPAQTSDLKINDSC